jgi:hypothetical protein
LLKPPCIVALRLSGDLNADRIADALTLVARRHTALRWSFPAPDHARCAPVDQACWPLDVVDSAGISAVDRAREEQELLAELEEPFRPEAFPLVRGKLLRWDGGGLLGLAIDHLVFDGASIGVFLNDLSYVHDRLAAGASIASLDRTVSDFAGFADAESRWLAGPHGASALDYWLDRWAGVGPFPRVPVRVRDLDPVRDPVMATTHEVTVPGSALKALSGTLRAGYFSPFMLIGAAFVSGLRNLSGENDLGFIYANNRRNTPEARTGIGFYINRVVLRVALDDAPEFGIVCAKVRTAALDGLRHGMMPFEELLSHVLPERQYRLPTVPYLYINDIPQPRTAQMRGLCTELVWPDRRNLIPDRNKLSVQLRGRPDGGVLVRCTYDESVFPRRSIEPLMALVTARLGVGDLEPVTTTTSSSTTRKAVR